MPPNLLFGQPSAPVLLDAIRGHLDEELRPKLSGKDAYDLRIASNLLEILKRELELGPKAVARAQSRLEQLLGLQASPEELNVALSDGIRDRVFDSSHGDLLKHLRQTTLDKLSIDNPGYSAYQRAVLASAGST